MKIALIGYGRMGKAIEEIAIKNGDEIVLKITSENKELFTEENIKKADVAIEFTNPEVAFENIKSCLRSGVPVISGSTGWLENLPAVINLCNELSGTFLYASNFSIGVNIFFEINKKLASLMSSHSEYDVSMEEIHHTGKKDAPSGTAITLAQQIIQENKTKDSWTIEKTKSSNVVVITSKREDPAPGTHHVKYNSPTDDIEIIHTAHNRSGFAQGALAAASFVKNKKGVFSMKDVLNIN
ncbi:MAG: 4-hydroxy-tetrahydrodipicolinate reductase [Ferruginibacter sp.]